MALKLKDVAKAAGVAINTASSILNSRKDSWASEETKKRVREDAEKPGYTPNRIARSLSPGKTNTIGLIIPDLQNPFYSALVTEIESEVIKRDYDHLAVAAPNCYQCRCCGSRRSHHRRRIKNHSQRTVDCP